MNPKGRPSQFDPLQTFGFLQSSPALEPTTLGLDISEAAVRGHRLSARSGHWLTWWACERVIEGLTTNAFQSTCP
jgi:hypothetical protein